MMMGYGNVMIVLPAITAALIMEGAIILRNRICTKVRPIKAIKRAVRSKAAVPVLVQVPKEDLAVNVSNTRLGTVLSCS